MLLIIQVACEGFRTDFDFLYSLSLMQDVLNSQRLLLERLALVVGWHLIGYPSAGLMVNLNDVLKLNT